VRLAQADALDPTQTDRLGRDYDLVVCTRFAYWLSAAELSTLAANLGRTQSRFLLIGGKVARHHAGRVRRGRKSVVKGLERLYRRLFQRIYDEAEFLRILATAGWQPVKQRPVIASRRAHYVYYLLRRAPASAPRPD
jgi:hypothetical protein